MPWVNVCSLAGHRTFLANSDDGTTGETLPFTFRYYGSPYSYVGIASNGQLSFVLPTYAWVNSMLPTSAVENTIFGFWDDIYQRNGICTATVGTAPLRRYIAEWEDNFFYPPGSSNASEHMIVRGGASTPTLGYQSFAPCTSSSARRRSRWARNAGPC